MSSINTAHGTTWSICCRNTCLQVLLPLRLRFRLAYFMQCIFFDLPHTSTREGELCRVFLGVKSSSAVPIWLRQGLYIKLGEGLSLEC